MKYRIAIAVLACVALSVQAASPKDPSPPQPASIMMKQRTVEILDPITGEVLNTKREVEIKMHDGAGNVVGVEPHPYSLTTASGEFKRVEMLSYVKNERGLKGNPFLREGTLTARVLKKGTLPRKMQEGYPVAGEWQLVEWQGAPDAVGGDGSAWTERTETWYRVAKRGEKVGLRTTQIISTSKYQRAITDYWYFETDRMHPSLFSAEKVVKIPALEEKAKP